MPASNISAFFKFDRQFGVPLDSSFVFQNSTARSGYLTNEATSGIAYTGMIVADLETNKVYMLNTSRQWQEVGITVNETFGANNSGIMIKTGDNTFAVRRLDSGNNISITNASGISGNPSIGLSSSVTGLTSLSSTTVTFSSGTVSSRLAVSGSLTLNGRDITTNIEAVPNTNTANFNLSVGSVSSVGTNGGPSYYGTYDQGGNVREIMHSGSTATLAVRGGNFANSTTDDALNKSIRGSRLPTDFGPGFGFRLASRENIGKSYLLTLSAGTGIATSGSVIHGFQIGDPLKFANDSGLPAQVSSGVTYYVVGTGSTTFSVSATTGGSAISFGGANTTTSVYSAYDYSSFVRVENSGNTADSNNYGAVNYNYRIGKFEITNDDYVEFLNAVARDDHDTSNTTHYISGFDRGLYEPLMETELPNNGISRNAVFPDYYYASLRGMNKKPVVFISYINAARYANWLHNGKPVSNRYKTCSIVNGTPTTVTLTNHGFANGDLITFNCIDGSSFGGGTLTRNTTFKVAGKTDNTFQVKTEANADVTFTGTGTFYVRKLFNKVLYIDNGAYTLAVNETTAKQKETNARYWIPTENEWYKAAYYDPAKGGPGVPGYWIYPTRSDTMPSGVVADANGNGSYNAGGTVPGHYHSSYDISDFVDRVDTIFVDGSGTQILYSPTSAGGSIAVNVTGIPLSNVVDVRASATEVNYLSGIIPGTGLASTVLALDINKSISGIANLTATTGVFSIGSFGPSNSLDSASTLKVGGTGVSLSGHKHYYTAGQGFVDIPNFCSGVADCVNTPLIVSTGLRADFSSNTLQLALSGQAATLHSFTGTGLMVRTSGPDNNGVFSARSIAQGTNISVANGDGVSANPTISLNASITGLTNVKSSNIYATSIYANDGQNTLNIYSPNVNVTGNLTVANLTVTGVTTTVNSTTITVQDPVLTLGGTGVISGADNLDRGLQLRYWNGSAAATGFMGWNNQSSEFIFLSSTTGTIDYNDYGAGTFGRVKVGSLVSNGAISGTDIYATNATSHRVAVFDANKMLFSTGVLTSELTHLTGVTSSIKDQLNSKAASGVSLTAGNGLTGGGSLSGNLSFDVGAGDGISVASDSVNVDATVLRTSGVQTISGVKTFSVAPIFSGGLTSSGTINLQVAATASTGSHFPVFVSDPTAGSQQLVSRTLAQMRTDLGTSLNTGNTLVLRDTLGNFGAGNITGTLIGNASTATNATSASGIYISGITSSDSLVSIVLVADQSASSQLPFIDSGLQYNANDDILILKNISGTLNIPFNGYTSPAYSSTSISGIIPMNGTAGTYLHNFIIDGGTP